MIEIKLTQGKVALVDEADMPLISMYKWSTARVKNSELCYALASEEPITGRHTTVRMHRIIMKAQKGTKVDHWDHDGLNNQRNNLRLASHSQNKANGPKYRTSRSKKTSSRFRGVSFFRRDGIWVASIRVSKKLHYLGRFAAEKDAAKAYDEAATKFFGEFACPNFPEGKIPL